MTRKKERKKDPQKWENMKSPLAHQILDGIACVPNGK